MSASAARNRFAGDFEQRRSRSNANGFPIESTCAKRSSCIPPLIFSESKHLTLSILCHALNVHVQFAIEYCIQLLQSVLDSFCFICCPVFRRELIPSHGSGRNKRNENYKISIKGKLYNYKLLLNAVSLASYGSLPCSHRKPLVSIRHTQIAPLSSIAALIGNGREEDDADDGRRPRERERDGEKRNK